MGCGVQMGNIKAEKRPWKERISLKGALLLTTIACVVMGIVCCMLEIYILSTVHLDIYESYVAPYDRGDGSTSFTFSITFPQGDAMIVDNGTEAYVNPETGEPYPEDTPSYLLVPAGFFRFIYSYSDIIAICLCFFTALMFFTLDAAWFYRWKLKAPLRELTGASDKISKNNLDFTVAQPSDDEMGRLCASFESMRSSLEKSNKAMWDSMEQRRRLNAAFAHDLRTPLTVLQGYGDYLLEGLPNREISEEKVIATVSAMKRSLTRLQRYVEGMSDLQKLEDISPRPRPFTLSALRGQIEETARILWGKESFTLSSQGDEEIFIDQEIFLQVFDNMASNAGRYRKNTIDISLRHERDMLFLKISDDGPGFPGEALKRGSEPYYRGEKQKSSSESPQHFGLGLYIVRLLCQKHGGFLLLKNRPEGGASVTAVFSVNPE